MEKEKGIKLFWDDLKGAAKLLREFIPIMSIFVPPYFFSFNVLFPVDPWDSTSYKVAAIFYFAGALYFVALWATSEWEQRKKSKEKRYYI